MFAVAFDMVVAETEVHHPKGARQAYADIGSILGEYGFNWIQGSLYVSENEDDTRKVGPLLNPESTNIPDRLRKPGPRSKSLNVDSITARLFLIARNPYIGRRRDADPDLASGAFLPESM